MIEARAHIAAMAPYALADMRVAPEKPLVSLAQNESALPPSPKALEAARQSLAMAELYPDPDWGDLRPAIAAVHGLDPDQILCGAGSMELIAALVHTFAGPEDEVLASDHAYAFFRTATEASAARYVSAPEQAMTVSVDALLDAVTPRTRIVCLANPGNPTGTRIADSEVTRLRDGLPEDVMLLVDEAYGEFAQGVGAFDLVSRGNTVVLRTFSKVYGLAGLRIGWGLFPPAVGTQVRKLLNPNNVTVTSQAAAAAAMADQAHMRAVRDETAARRDRFIAALRALGLSVPDSHTNFALIRFADAAAAERADLALRAEGLLLRGMGGYGLPDCLRATIAGEAALRQVVDILAQSIQQETAR